MVIERSPVRRNEFDSSDEEDETFENITPFHVDWVDLSFTGCSVEVIGIGGLPGCKFRGANRNLNADIGDLKTMGITDVFVFCTHGEMVRCRVPYLIDEYHCAGFEVHHFPVEVGDVPTMNECANVIGEVQHCIGLGGKALLHCVSGLGISCLVVAILLLSQDELMSPENAITKLRQIRGQGAVHTVKEYNFVFEFRDLFKQHLENQQNSREVPPRSISR